MKTLFKIALALTLTIGAFAQATTSSTTTSAAVAVDATVIALTSTSGMSSATLGAFNTELYIDSELIGVQTVVNSTTVVVQRGLDGTRQSTHASGATVWNGPPSYFSPQNFDPSGACVPGNIVALPRFFTNLGNGWDCPTTGPRTNLWTLRYPRQNAALAADSSLTGLTSTQVCHAQYSFAVDGGAVGAITPSKNCTIPKGALVYKAVIYNNVAPVGSTGNVSVGLTAGGAGAASLLAATARGSLTVGTIFQGVPVDTTASTANSAFFAMSAAGSVNVTVATNALTAGIIDVYVFYVMLPV